MARPKGSKNKPTQEVLDTEKLSPESRLELLTNLLVECLAEELEANAVSN